ncbi:YqiA/YcfP family alpha/beta fold hydrolase [Microbulbifer sp. 2201CG32-9]|uniref:YqiA/YcfP family alpha/beta fold hydrolase n=1 Tax=Microbulbifer sp. 2201CG32-9 TaxID=3232309 RepID=UPI00345B52B8
MSAQQSVNPPLLIYLHGFLSSSQSFKCRSMCGWLARAHSDIAFAAPQLSPHPGKAMAVLTRLIDDRFAADADSRVGLLGSSMGGFFATVLAERYRLPAVLVNPAVRPARFMPAYLGQTLIPYSGEARDYRLTEADVDTMQQLEDELPQPLTSRYWLLAQRGDETLDCREAEVFYRGERQTVEDGGNHSFAGYERYRQPIIDFLFKQQ